MSKTDDLHDFVYEALKSGQSRPAISAALVEAGWDQGRVDAALASYAESPFALPVPKPRPSLSARDMFFYLLLFTCLYVSVFYFIDMIFAFINLALPDVMRDLEQFRRRSEDAIRIAISALLIFAPLFIFMNWRHQKNIAADQTHRVSPIRRWLTYLTLFAAAIAVLGDFATLIYTLLTGDITLRFTLKFFTVAIIAGGLFIYYLHDMRTEEIMGTRDVR